jgi:hypothetical protein
VSSISNSKFEKSGGISGGQRVKWLKHKIKKVLPQQFQIQNVVQDTKALKCLRSRGFVSICGISVMLYLVIDQVCLQVADSPRG